jgi:hypothetical protein
MSPHADNRERVVQIAASLPEVEVQPRGAHVGFAVKRRRFAWYLEDHHGDGRIALTCKADPDWRDALVRSHPGRYFVPSYVGHLGWVGVWLDVPNVDWDEVAESVTHSYRLVAPKRLGEAVDDLSD